MQILHRIKTEPAVEPITLAEMRAHLGITQAADISRDAIITTRIVSARQWAEYYTRMAFITQTWTANISNFPYRNLYAAYASASASLSTSYCDKIYLKTPLISVTSIKYLDSNGIQQILAADQYLVDTVSGCVVPVYNVSWPSARTQQNSVQIEYICGYGAAGANVPESIKDGIRFIVGQWEVFQSSIEGVMRPFTIPNAAKQLLDNYTDLREAF